MDPNAKSGLKINVALARLERGDSGATDQPKRKTPMDYLIGAVIGVSASVFVCWLIFMAWCWTWGFGGFK